MIGFAFIFLFAAAQGGVIFATAWIAARGLGATSAFSKMGLMLASYVFWISLTIAGYFLLGGDGGLMDGFGFVSMLCVTALISAFIYAVAWALVPSQASEPNG